MLANVMEKAKKRSRFRLTNNGGHFIDIVFRKLVEINCKRISLIKKNSEFYWELSKLFNISINQIGTAHPIPTSEIFFSQTVTNFCAVLHFQFVYRTTLYTRENIITFSTEKLFDMGMDTRNRIRLSKRNPSLWIVCRFTHSNLYPHEGPSLYNIKILVLNFHRK